ncbi:unnamed protein product [Vitrella brassicaformis CCMP3155]|uniref:Vacuolar protein sorting-associated protein 28 homolog n=2 Tax=Vitrella brassicaformis TaxID=1169539 RepID=A0A0G4G9M4_VITBC|nr:unnamed protein product [Vitrella brassicaformis CCMP3155]|mmetsp:Transcript_1032/g.2689  ORF Transcript_1032/g.2689 Transcript_1032/m.2689 type:complete len:212 (-) Transcript_1032:2793-3428(-)|eukprot:CEM25716.1 unnamed protein product [Vitrella brassicaformis CCMP3155]
MYDSGGETVVLTPEETRSLQHSANLYSIIRTVEHLEKAFVNGWVMEQDYERECMSLIAQFKTLQRALKDKYPDIREFLDEYDLDCPLATDRLLESGVPATKLYATGQAASKAESLLVFELSGHFITLLDAVRLNQRAVDEIQPLVSELVSSLNRVGSLPHDMAGIQKVKEWIYTLNRMSATDELSDSQSRQLSMDVENAYSAFRNWLQSPH